MHRKNYMFLFVLFVIHLIVAPVFAKTALNMTVDLTRMSTPLTPELNNFSGFLYHEALHYLNATSPTFNLSHGDIWRAQKELIKAFPGKNTIFIPPQF